MLKFQGYTPQANGFNSPVVTPDYLLPNEELLQRAQNGDPSAQYLTGIDLRTGCLGGIINNNEGNKWVVAASQHPVQSPAVLCAIGKCYRHALGNVVIQDADLAKQYFQAAADQGYIPATHELASMKHEESFIKSTSTINSRTATHVHQDSAKAQEVIRLLRTAAGAKYPPSYTILSECYLYGHGVQKNANEAFRIAQLGEAEGKGSAYGKMLLGDFHKYGWGGAQRSKAEAKKWYREARDQGFDIEGRLSRCTIM